MASNTSYAWTLFDDVDYLIENSRATLPNNDSSADSSDKGMDSANSGNDEEEEEEEIELTEDGKRFMASFNDIGQSSNSKRKQSDAQSNRSSASTASSASSASSMSISSSSGLSACGSSTTANGSKYRPTKIRKLVAAPTVEKCALDVSVPENIREMVEHQAYQILRELVLAAEVESRLATSTDASILANDSKSIGDTAVPKAAVSSTQGGFVAAGTASSKPAATGAGNAAASETSAASNLLARQVLSVYSPPQYFRLIVGAIISNCTSDLGRLIDRLCHPECVLKTIMVQDRDTAPFSNKVMKGRAEICDFFRGIIEAFPDIEWAVENSKFIDSNPLLPDREFNLKAMMGHFTAKGTMLTSIHETHIEQRFSKNCVNQELSNELRSKRPDVQTVDSRGMTLMVLNEWNEIEKLYILFIVHAKKSTVENL